jgi:hypothetical protein
VSKSTVEILRGAREVLERNGWNQGWFFRDDDPGANPAECAVCLRGALNLSAGAEHPGSPAACGDALMAVNDALPERWRGLIAGWNDERGRTVEEVYALLDRAIELAEGGVSDGR